MTYDSIPDFRFVRHIASRYARWADFDDLVQEGMIALLAAREHYDKSKGAFSTYAYRCIFHRVRGYARMNASMLTGAGKRRGGSQKSDPDRAALAEAAIKPTLGIDDVIEDWEERLPGEFDSPEAIAAANEERALLTRLRREELSVREDAVVSRVIDWREPTYGELGAAAGVSRQRIEQVYSRAVGKMAEAMGT